MISRLTAVLAAACIALVSGCASVPEASPEQDQQAKQFSAPRNMAGVYIFRNEMMGMLNSLDVILDGKPLGATKGKTYLYTEVAPGRHTVTGKGENESTVTFDAVAGRLYFMWQEVKMGLMSPRNELKVVDEATGKAGVMESKRVLAPQGSAGY